MEDLLDICSRRRTEFNAVNLSTAIFSLAKGLVTLDDPALGKLLGDIRVAAYEFGAQAVANTAWALARLRVSDPSILDATWAAGRRRVNQLSAQGLANLAWAHATLEYVDLPLSEALGTAGSRVVTELNSQGLANFVWAFAKMRVPDRPLFAAIEAALPALAR